MVVHVDIFRKQCCHFQYADPFNRGLRSQSTEKWPNKLEIISFIFRNETYWQQKHNIRLLHIWWW